MRKDDEKVMEVFSRRFTEGEVISLLKSAEKLENIALDEKIGWCLHFIKTDRKKLSMFLKCLESRAVNCEKETQKPIYNARAEEVRKLLKQA